MTVSQAAIEGRVSRSRLDHHLCCPAALALERGAPHTTCCGISVQSSDTGTHSHRAARFPACRRSYSSTTLRWTVPRSNLP